MESNATNKPKSECIEEFCANAKTGDILFFESDKNSIASKMIKSWLMSSITHIGLVFKPQKDMEMGTFGTLKKDVCYFWEMGRNTDAKTALGNGGNFTEARLVNAKEMLIMRKTTVYWKRLEMNEKLLGKGLSNFTYQKICSLVESYIENKVTSPYDPYISSLWLMRDGIWPFAPRFHDKIEDQFLSVKAVNPKHCSQLTFQTCAYAKIFRTRKDSYTISPGDIYHLTRELCSPFVTFSDSITIKEFESTLTSLFSPKTLSSTTINKTGISTNEIFFSRSV